MNSKLDSIDAILLFVVVPAIVLASLLEAWVLSRRTRYDWRASGISVMDLVLRILINLTVPLALSTPVTQFAQSHKLTTLHLDTWQTVLLLFLGQEFCYYWFHRAAHRVRWFWCNHAVHHSPNDLNLTAALRIGLFGKLTGTFIFFAPLVWLGFEPRLVAQALTLNLLYQFWIHATWIPKLGWMEYVFNTPSAHRVHHASNPQYLDANYGGVLIIFDRLFGTYVAERKDIPIRYGLVKPQRSYNPLRVEFDEWVSLVRDMVKAPSLKDALAHVVMPPAWRPARAAVQPAPATPSLGQVKPD
ncbi:MAG: sterol desaturase family protein [Alphaproteobacteria bacterium]|nr:MAG: sterol desaturase family protein [Alphaproteobacteria bacterium]